MKKSWRILFLCTGNSARSILAEFLMRRLGSGRFASFSAGSDPKPAPHPLALKVLREHYGVDVSDARSKSWKVFEGQTFDFVITLCDSAKETCPVWPNQPVVAHWGSPDPAAFEGTDEERERQFWRVAQQIHRRLELFTSLSIDKLDSLRLQSATEEIGTQATQLP
ncbi:MAG: arsenate reductase ArsC [Terrimicrobiaceae bacterium]|nr:arsenate reductase ArsC [Terrimicrobiaceae bacterium]